LGSLTKKWLRPLAPFDFEQDACFVVRDGNGQSGRGSLMNDLEIAAFSPTSRVSASQDLEVKMTSVKALAIIALLVGGTSLAAAQSGPATGGEPPVAGGAAGNPAVPNAPSAYGATKSKSAHKKTSKSQKKSQ
jgi:hypothetical protein